MKISYRGVLSSSAVDRGFEPRSGQAKKNKIGICCFSAKHAALKRKSKDWLGITCIKKNIPVLYSSIGPVLLYKIISITHVYNCTIERRES
jgi:hypothetical protein